MMNEPLPICDVERAILARLANCTFLPATPQKRFAQQARSMLEMTEKQYDWACQLVIAYRRQMWPKES